jgi:hypothetical protein
LERFKGNTFVPRDCIFKLAHLLFRVLHLLI